MIMHQETLRGLRNTGILIFALIGTNALLGCASMREDRFIAQPSPLDSLQIIRTHLPHGTDRPETLRLDLNGSGYLRLTAGRSERVRSGFWQESASPDWLDLRQDHVFLSPARTRAYFQAFVNAGFFDKPPRKQEEHAELVVLIALGKRKAARFTAAPVYHHLFEELLSEF